MIKLQAHRGVSTEAPENTLPAIELAAAQGYSIAEVDVSVTKDGTLVLLHDDTLNRTARRADGSAIEEHLPLAQLTYEETMKYDFGGWFSKKYEGTPIPLFTDILKFARTAGIKLKIDNKYQRFASADKQALYDLLAQYDDIAALTCSTIDALQEALEQLPNLEYHYDGPISAEILEELSSLLPRERLTVWAPLQNENTGWVKVAFADEALARLIKQYARLGLWILSKPEELAQAEALGAEVVETTGSLKPMLREGVLADMHLHSQNSHDSQCPVIDMARAQAANGVKLMAVTDHCDVGFTGIPELSRIEASYEEVQQTDALVTDLQILTGVEIGGSFMQPDLAEVVAKRLPYDVIIGSVHSIVDPISKKPLGLHGAKEFSEENMYQYMGAYYDCMRIMIDVLDFDILAHMTYPIRYLTGRFGYKVDLERLRERIDDILQAIIRKGIALEINTSSYDLLSDTMPGRELVQRYFDMGGYLVTLGSDAHAADKADKAFAEAVAMLKEIGFENIYYYRGRKAQQCKLA